MCFHWWIIKYITLCSVHARFRWLSISWPVLSSGSFQHLWRVWACSVVKGCRQQSADRKCESYAPHPSDVPLGIFPVSSSKYGHQLVHPEKKKHVYHQFKEKVLKMIYILIMVHIICQFYLLYARNICNVHEYLSGTNISLSEPLQVDRHIQLLYLNVCIQYWYIRNTNICVALQFFVLKNLFFGGRYGFFFTCIYKKLPLLSSSLKIT